MSNARRKPDSTSEVAYSKLSVKSQTVVPRAVRERLRLSPGDRVRFVIEGGKVTLERDSHLEDGDPFVAFTEWASPEDDEAYADL